jgi:hypothetical protein
MRSTQQIVITSHRLARFTTWARLYLGWLVSVRRALGVEPAVSALEQWPPLERMRREVRNIIFLHAFSRVQPPRPSPRFHALKSKRRGLRAAICGSALRRLVRRAGLLELLDIICSLEPHVAKLARRLRRGLTRRRRAGHATAFDTAFPLFAHRLEVAGADTS